MTTRRSDACPHFAARPFRAVISWPAPAPVSAAWPWPRCWQVDAGRRCANRRPSAGDAAAQQPHFPATAKSVIWCFLDGGPSHIDLFDPKPELDKLAGQPLPDSFDRPLTAMGSTAYTPLLATQAQVRPARPVGPVGQRLVSGNRHLRRRHGRDSQLPRRWTQPRRQRVPDEHRQHPGRPAVAGLVVLVRPGQRKRGPARLRRADR